MLELSGEENRTDRGYFGLAAEQKQTMIDDIAREGDFEEDNEPDGDVMRTPDGHYYEMGVAHDCNHPDCPANTRD